MSGRLQTAIGLTLAALILGGWLVLHVYSVFFHSLDGAGLVVAPVLLLAITWLNVGLFIVAHDAMHGSLAPRRPAVNLWVGRTALALYAGFSYDQLAPRHFDHHRHSGTGRDPDFSVKHPKKFDRWYLAFLGQYFGWREFIILSFAIAAYLVLLGAPLVNLLVFWALPAILSSLQLFLFGTYLPHRHTDAPFVDRHCARSNEYAPLISLLTCYHFGYHHEHHLQPHLPWWKLPAARAAGRGASR
jgi:beta-carotene/zeaxanthin 4-ketolase